MRASYLSQVSDRLTGIRVIWGHAVSDPVYLFIYLFIYYEIRTTRYTNKNTMWKKENIPKMHKKYIMKYIKTIS